MIFTSEIKIQNQPPQKNNTKNLDQNTSQKERKNRKMTEQIIPQEQIDKSEHLEINHVKIINYSSHNLKY